MPVNRGLDALLQLKMSECRDLCDLLTSTADDEETIMGSPTDLIDVEPDLIDEIDLDDFLDQEGLTVPDLSKFKRKSKTFLHLSLNKNVLLFVRMVTEEILKLPEGQVPPGNLTNEQTLALESLKNHQEIIIKNSDKGGNVVVLDQAHFKSICNKILSNQQWYRLIDRL